MLLIAAAACTQSRVDPGADIQVDGKVTRQNGLNSSGTKVLLGREGDLGEALSVGVFLGLTCLNEDPPPICRKAEIAETGTDGRFSFSVKGSFTQGFLGQANTVVLSTRLPRMQRELEGPAVTVRFQVQTTSLDMPLNFWEPKVEATADSLQGRVSWSELPGSVAPPDANLAAATTDVRFQQQGDLVWQFPRVPSGMSFDTRLLEDSRGDVSVTARIEDVEVADERGRRIDIILRSARLPYASPAGKPVSRGKTCSPAPAPCWLTDGDFSMQAEPPSAPGDNTASVDLGEPHDIRLVVVRGCQSTCALETSPDGQAWSQLGSASGDAAITPPAPVSARFVRVTSEQSIDQLRELSVWDPSSPEPAAEEKPLIVDTEAVPEGRDLDGGSRKWLLWVAIALVLALLVGVLMIVRARR